MGGITTEEIAKIRSSVDIVDVVSSYMPLNKRGKNYFGVCPFHQDTNPSLSVSPERQIYTCFSCGATGNVFNFIMDYENISFPEALKLVADKSGININIATNNKKDESSSPLYEMYEFTQRLYQNNINTEFGNNARKYLENRNISEDIIKEFGIGLSLKERDIITNALLKKGYSQKELIKSGLVIKNEYGYSDIFYNRIMFPLSDPSGKIVGFSGRTYDNDNGPKYINTQETEIFKKGETLYNYHRAREECRKTNSVIIMEGFMDVIRSYTVGIKNVIATMGTAVTREQALLIKRLGRDVYLCFDGDDAGSRATLACAEELEKVGVTPKVIVLPGKLDPDDFILKNGFESFNYQIDNAKNLIDFKLEFLKNHRDLTKSEDLAIYINDSLKEVSKIEDDILREITLKKISLETNFDIDFLRSKVTLPEEKPKTIINKINLPKLINNKYIKAEQYLLFYMLRSKDVIKSYNKKITYLPTDRYRKLANEITYFYKDNRYIDIADLLINLNGKEELIKTVHEIELLELPDEPKDYEIDDYINVIKEYNINYEIKRLQNKLKETNNINEKAEILEKIAVIRKEGVEND